MRKRDDTKLPPSTKKDRLWRPGRSDIRSSRRYSPAGSSLTQEQIDALRAYWAEWIADADTPRR